MKKQVGSLQGSATSGTRALSPEHRSNLDVTGHKRYEGLNAVRRCCRSLLLFLLWELMGPSLPSVDKPTYTACIWDAHFCISLPPFRSPTWAHPGQTRFQSVAVCSMYIDEFLTLYIRTVQVWYSYSHSGFYFIIFLVFFNQHHCNISRIVGEFKSMTPSVGFCSLFCFASGQCDCERSKLWDLTETDDRFVLPVTCAGSKRLEGRVLLQGE